jgi:hypothetical protein
MLGFQSLVESEDLPEEHRQFMQEQKARNGGK